MNLLRKTVIVAALGLGLPAFAWAAATNGAPTNPAAPAHPATAAHPATLGAPGVPAAATHAPAPSGISSFTPADWKELREARETAMKTNPELVRNAAALADRMKAFQKKLDDAMIRANPNVAETLTKLERMTPQALAPGSIPMGAPRPTPAVGQPSAPVPNPAPAPASAATH